MQLINHPNEFKEGYRILMRCRRNKDGEGNSGGDRSSKKVITRSPEEFEEGLSKLLLDILPGERIYSTVDAREPEKAIRNFKQRQLEADYYDTESHRSFYVDVFNRFVSSLQAPNARATSLFLFDCDSAEDGLECWNSLEKAGVIKNVIHHYQTKNGKHIITRPFNPQLLPDKIRGILQKNAMMLLAY